MDEDKIKVARLKETTISKNRGGVIQIQRSKKKYLDLKSNAIDMCQALLSELGDKPRVEKE